MKLPKLIFSLFVLVFPCQLISAQSHQTTLKAGLNINDLGGKEAGIYNSFGFHAGLQYEHFFNSSFSLQPELLFSLQGGTLEQSSNTKLRYYYLNLPILAKVYLVDNFSFEAGPQIGYLLSARQTSDFGKVKVTGNVKKTDIAAVFGFAYKYRNKTSLSVRYNLGFSNTIEQGVIFQRRLNNRVFQASLGFVL